MDISSLSISLPTVVTIVGLFIGIMTYFGNRKRQNKVETEEEVKDKSELEARLVSMEKDIQYIRMTVDKIDKRYETHETRISKLEAECVKRKK